MRSWQTRLPRPNRRRVCSRGPEMADQAVLRWAAFFFIGREFRVEQIGGNFQS